MDLRDAVWHKSSRSNGNGGNCVEVAGNLPNIVAVRDSKNRAGAVLTFGHGDPEAWAANIAVDTCKDAVSIERLLAEALTAVPELLLETIMEVSQ